MDESFNWQVVFKANYFQVSISCNAKFGYIKYSIFRGGIWLINFIFKACYLFHLYRPPTKMREGKIFIRFILFGEDVPCDHYPWCTGPHCRGTPLGMGHETLPYPLTSDIWWPSLETCSNVFTSGLLLPHQCRHLVVKHIWSVQEVVCILVECFLVKE